MQQTAWPQQPFSRSEGLRCSEAADEAHRSQWRPLLQPSATSEGERLLLRLGALPEGGGEYPRCCVDPGAVLVWGEASLVVLPSEEHLLDIQTWW